MNDEPRTYARTKSKLERECHFKTAAKVIAQAENALQTAFESRRRIVKLSHDELRDLLGRIRAVREFWE